MQISIFRRVTFSLVCLLGLHGAAHGQSATLTLLGVGSANAINDSGQIVGDLNGQAVEWNGGVATVLGSVGGTGSTATAISNSGLIAGISSLGSTEQSVEWNGTTPTVLGSPGGNNFAYGINDSGQVVGTYSQSVFATGAVIWNGTTPSALGVVDPSATYPYGIANGINNNGVAAGSVATAGAATNSAAVIWNGSTPTVLGSINWTSSTAYAINNSGQVVGQASVGYGSVPVLWNGTTPTVLSLIGGSTGTGYATAINNLGQVVGNSVKTGDIEQAVIWDGTNIINLNSYLTPAEISAGWGLGTATGINDSGTIVGEAFNSVTYTSEAYELTGVVLAPVPESSSIAMLLAGLCMLGVAAGRRSRSK